MRVMSIGRLLQWIVSLFSTTTIKDLDKPMIQLPGEPDVCVKCVCGVCREREALGIPSLRMSGVY